MSQQDHTGMVRGMALSELPSSRDHRSPTSQQDHTGMVLGLVLAAVATLLVVAALAVSLAVLVSRWQHQHGSLEVHTSDQSEEDVCLTPGCIHAASLVLSKLDPSVDPCDDFYQYACGNYVRTTNIPDDKSSVDTISALNDQLLEKLRNAIEEEDTQAVVPRSLQLARDFYRACMNKKVIESRGLAPLQRVLREELGGWPAVEGGAWAAGAGAAGGFHWPRSARRFHGAGYSDGYFLKVSVATDHHNSSRRALYLDVPSLGLSREQLVKGSSDKLVAAYHQYQVDLAVMLGANREFAEQELNESLTFEITLARMMGPERSRLYSVAQLQRGYPSVRWLQFLRALLPPHVAVSNDEVVIVKAPTYLKKLELLMMSTPKRVAANYAAWRAAEASARYSTEELRERRLLLHRARSGSSERQPRSRECVQDVATGLPLSAGAIYVRRYFDEAARQAALEMVNDIRQEFLHTLREVDWMDEDTRRKAIDKAQSMVAHIAYPDELLDDNKLDQFYEKLEVNTTMYLESLLNVTKFLTDNSFSRLRQPVNKTDWVTHGDPTAVNAYYDSKENSIQFPAAILQGAFFSADRPRYINYGAIGSTIGHEITHGFDDQGRKYDKEGNRVDWWDPVTRDKFLEKAACISLQYGNFTDKQTGLKLNGDNTLGENIADSGGVKGAYRAYLSLERRAGRPERRLPALGRLCPRQMFWLAYAQTWCSKYRTEQIRHVIETEVHPPSRFRVLGALSNRPEFAADFNCPAGSPMNPVHKCQVW